MFAFVEAFANLLFLFLTGFSHRSQLQFNDL